MSEPIKYHCDCFIFVPDYTGLRCSECGLRQKRPAPSGEAEPETNKGESVRDASASPGPDASADTVDRSRKPAGSPVEGERDADDIVERLRAIPSSSLMAVAAECIEQLRRNHAELCIEIQRLSAIVFRGESGAEPIGWVTLYRNANGRRYVRAYADGDKPSHWVDDSEVTVHPVGGAPAREEPDGLGPIDSRVNLSAPSRAPVLPPIEDAEPTDKDLLLRVLNTPQGTLGDCDEWDAVMHEIDARLATPTGTAPEPEPLRDRAAAWFYQYMRGLDTAGETSASSAFEGWYTDVAKDGGDPVTNLLLAYDYAGTQNEDLREEIREILRAAPPSTGTEREGSTVTADRETGDAEKALAVYIVLTAEANTRGLAPTVPDDVRAWAEAIVAAHDGSPVEVFEMIRALRTRTGEPT